MFVIQNVLLSLLVNTITIMIRIIRTVSSLRKAKKIFKLHLLVSFEMKSNFECVFVLSRFNFSVLQKYCTTTKDIFFIFMHRQHNRRTVIKILKKIYVVFEQRLFK